ncbi:hypothetical protein EUGRSUZ_C04190 [Eucalyptus grandis]|uniref:Uncharacterized protein n=2 Tax=Eucalyptus grandis TaxID=71139 RepID=A0ACC3LKG2_EUCGR|nr:hypothetical protein EUGRSUZ_C04190 [Eucalyptus grandis]
MTQKKKKKEAKNILTDQARPRQRIKFNIAVYLHHTPYSAASKTPSEPSRQRISPSPIWDCTCLWWIQICRASPTSRMWNRRRRASLSPPIDIWIRRESS